MPDVISAELLDRLCEVFRVRVGLSFSPDRYKDLQRGLRGAMREFGFTELEACVRWLLDAPLSRAQIETLARHLTIGETYFFRDGRSFEILRDQILRPLLNARQGKERRLRLWSAACSSGEEAYSIAILLQETVPRLEDWNITLLATDLNPSALDRAREGVYSTWSFRALPDALRDKYFRMTGNNRYALADSIKRMVKFEYLNLVEDAFPSPLSNTHAMDVILCRNVLMYFAPAAAQGVIHKMYRALTDGGYLLTSSNEGPQINYAPFKILHQPGAILYRKIENVSAGTSTPPTRTTTRPRLDLPPLPPRALAPQETSPPPKTPRVTTPAKPVFEEDFARAQSLFEAGEYSAAAAILEPLAGKNEATKKARVLELLSRCAANEGKLDPARSWCESALALNKLNPSLYHLRATILQEQGDSDGATAALRQALYLDPDFIAAHLASGNLSRAQNKTGEARKHFSNALQLLRRLDPQATLPEAEGMTAGRLIEIIEQWRE